eukprot:411562_1
MSTVYNNETKQEDTADLKIAKLLSVLSHYQSHGLNAYDIQLDIHDVLNDFLYLLEHHNDEYSFQRLYELFGGFCDINHCAAFQRNYRNRANEHWDVTNPLYANIDSTDIVKQQIMDRIHCYYRHSFDMGYRLGIDEKQPEQKPKNKPSNEQDHPVLVSTVPAININNLSSQPEQKPKKQTQINNLTDQNQAKYTQR